jgi:hypothetical protein
VPVKDARDLPGPAERSYDRRAAMGTRLDRE